jgi:long-subunit fatty acid transport protein
VWLIDTLNGYQDAYGTIFSAYGENANSDYGQVIRRVIENKGYMGEHTFTVAGNYSNKIFFGAAFAVTSLRYVGHYEHLEIDEDGVIPDFKNFVYTDHLDARGTGYALKLGAVVRPVEMLRIGFSFHTPTLFRIHEYYYDNITSKFDTPDSQGKTAYEAENDPYRYSYTLTTPLRFNAGVALQLKKLAVITADYELIDYRMARFSNASDDYNYFDENESIKDVLKASQNLRFGAEIRLSTLYVRGGYGLYGSAFEKDEVNAGLDYNQVSFGVGFRQQNMFFDLGFSSLTSSSKYYMYIDEPYLQPATFTNTKSTFAATLGFKF